MLQGQFLLIEETNKCLTPRPIYCFDTRKTLPRLYLLDRETDSFILQTVNIDLHGHDFFTLEIY